MQGLWQSLETLSIGSGVLEEWRREMGPEFESCSKFLTPTPYQVESYPCTSAIRCHCRHRITYQSEEHLLAVCDCHDGGCDPIPLAPRDVIVYALDGVRFGAAIRDAFGFAGSVALDADRRSARNLGTWKDRRTPVYFYVPVSEDSTVREIERLELAASNPYVLLTPSDRFCGPRVHGALRRNGSVQLGLSDIVSVNPTGALKLAEHSVATLDTVISELERRRLARPDATVLLREIHHAIATIRTEHQELRAAKSRLEEMQAQGLFKFTQKIDPHTFKIFCTILSEGDIAKAARTLNMRDSTLRDTIKHWPKRGDAYKKLPDLIRWRKSVGRKSTIPLNDAILTAQAKDIDYPSLIADVLDTLLSMTETNWEEKVAELADVLRPVIRD